MKREREAGANTTGTLWIVGEEPESLAVGRLFAETGARIRTTLLPSNGSAQPGAPTFDAERYAWDDVSLVLWVGERTPAASAVCRAAGERGVPVRQVRFMADMMNESAAATETLCDCEKHVDVRGPAASKASGELILVGAGPGDARLVTLAAIEALQRADVVLYDRLVSSALLRYAPQAEHVPVGRHEAGKVAETHAAIDRRIVEEASAGRCVVRLKGGDPLVFGRAAQELEVARKHGIPCSIVPGVTSACAAAAEEEFPLTARGTAGAVVFVTGHRMHGVPEPRWELLARSNETLVVYMGAARAAEIARRLIEGGRSPNEPTAIVHAASRAEQRVRYQRLQELIDGSLTAACKPPCVIVIGPVVRLGKNCPAELGGAVSDRSEECVSFAERRVDA
ncbi:hypothetical protein JCM19992_30190 [Thermostilla marina]